MQVQIHFCGVHFGFTKALCNFAYYIYTSESVSILARRYQNQIGTEKSVWVQLFSQTPALSYTLGKIYVCWSRWFADGLVTVNRAAQDTRFLLPLGSPGSLLPGLFTSKILLLVLKVQRETAALKSSYIVFDLLWKPPLPLSGWADGPLALAFSWPLAASLLFLSLLWPGFKNVWSLGICIGWWEEKVVE